MFTVAKEGRAYIFTAVFAAILSCVFLSLTAGIILFLTAGFITYFFRDPKRQPEVSDQLIYSPADGTVTDISTIEESDYLKDRVIRVSIFLSIWDVHINRSPVQGSVVFEKYTPGKFHNALFEKAFRENENNLIAIKNNRMTVLIRQIAGTIARRIVCYAKMGSNVSQGERIGLIKFGSGMQVYLPKTVKLRIKPGDKVKGAQTVIAAIGES